MKIVFIGAGNVATHLAPALEKSGVGHICQVYSRTETSAKKLCESLSYAQAVTEVSDIMTDGDLYVVSLADQSVGGVVNQLREHPEFRRGNALWVHTSGSLPMETLSALTDKYGVLYPLQTFSKTVEVDMRKVPLFLEANDENTLGRIRHIAEKISDKIYYADSERRRRMHIAAVFACNFTNYMFTVADDLLRKDGLTLEVLYPLMEETFRKAMRGNPAQVQTGPAVRGDQAVVHRHASMLPNELSGIYLELSDAIFNRSKK